MEEQLAICLFRTGPDVDARHYDYVQTYGICTKDIVQPHCAMRSSLSSYMLFSREKTPSAAADDGWIRQYQHNKA